MKPRNIDPLIAEILDTEIIGNASSDRPLLDACHAVLMDESRSHKIGRASCRERVSSPV